MGTVVPVLTRWGVSADADLVYRALLQLAPRDAPELARDLGMSRQRVRTAVDELVALGALKASGVLKSSGVLRTSGELTPVAVDDVLRTLQRPRRAAVAELSRDRWRRHVAAVDGLGPLATAATVRRWSRASARRRAAQLVDVEKYEHLAINTEEVFTAESLSAARPLDRSLIDRGVRALVIERTPLNGDRGVPARSVADIPEGFYRQTDDVPLKLMVFDRRVAFFPADPLDLEHGYVEVADPAAVERCCALFHKLWASGRDPFRHGVSPIELSVRERNLLHLLAGGHTDLSAAAGLGISPRSLTYAMRALMDRAGVDNRFQLGLLLGSTGTVRPPHLPGDDNVTDED